MKLKTSLTGWVERRKCSIWQIQILMFIHPQTQSLFGENMAAGCPSDIYDPAKRPTHPIVLTERGKRGWKILCFHTLGIFRRDILRVTFNGLSLKLFSYPDKADLGEKSNHLLLLLLGGLGREHLHTIVLFWPSLEMRSTFSKCSLLKTKKILILVARILTICSIHSECAHNPYTLTKCALPIISDY